MKPSKFIFNNLKWLYSGYIGKKVIDYEKLDKRFIDKKKVLKLINIDIFNMLDINMRDKLGRAKNKTEINNILSDYLKDLKNNNKILKLLEE